MRKKTKFLFLRASIILAFAILAGRIWYIQVVMGAYYRQQGDTSKIRLEPVAALRGIIYDSQGRPLVYNAPSWNVHIVPHGVPSGQATRIYTELSQLLHNSPTPQKIASIVHQNEWQSYQPALIKNNVSPDIAMVIKQLHEELPGVSADPSSRRQYVNDSALSLAHILGYTGKLTPSQYARGRRLYPAERYTPNDEAGQDGVEYAVDQYLHGVNGTAQVEVDSGERPIRVIRPAHPLPGDRVYLTIDSHFQQQVAGDLQTGLNHVNLRQGAAIVEDVHTGAILAMVSLPSFDNNWFTEGNGISQSRYDSLLHDPATPLNNLAIAGQLPPGSIFKIITAAAALQTGSVTASTIVNDKGVLIPCPGCHEFYGWDSNGLGPMNLVSALSHSSDIYFYTVAGGDPNNYPNITPVGPDRLAHYAHLFGLGSPTGIELPNEAAGQIPGASWFNHLNNPILRHPGDTWHLGNTYNMAIGQGFNLVTPLQMVNVTATIANGGTLYHPQIIKRIVGRWMPGRGVLRRSRVIQPFVPSIQRRNFIDPTNIGLIQQGMHDSVQLPVWQGTSYLAQDPRIDAAGKTGTAEDPHGADSWWVGYAPFNDPKIAVVVLAPSANSEGAYVAAPIAHKIMEDYFHLNPETPDGQGSNWLGDVSINLTGAR